MKVNPRAILSGATWIMVAGLLGAATGQADATVLYRWGQLVPNKDGGGKTDLMVRAVVEGNECPSIHVNGAKDQNLKPAKRDKPKNFDQITLCETRLSHGDDLVKSFSTIALDAAGQITLKLPDLSKGVPLSSMVSFGCTGCRQAKQQATCKDGDWAYPQVLADANNQGNVGGMPPVVVHLGDIRYAGQKTEADSWTLTSTQTLGWQEEFFEPARDLLANGWWIVMRGNHEACLTDPSKEWLKKKGSLQDRGAAWFYFFDDQENSCKQALDNHDVMPAYGLDATYYSGGKLVEKNPGVRLVVMDTVRTGDSRDSDPKKSAELYGKQFDAVAKDLGSLAKGQPFWLLTHIPLASTAKYGFADTVVRNGLDLSHLAKEIKTAPLSIAAHHHEFELINPEVGNPTSHGPLQYVVGNGGVLLSANPDYEEQCKVADIQWKSADGKKNEATWADLSRGNYGYLLTTLAGSGEGQLQPRFYNLASKSWSTDNTVDCTVTSAGQVNCGFLPSFNKTPKCPAD